MKKRCVSALVIVLFLSLPVLAQPQPFSIPQDPVAAYFSIMVIPTLQGRVSPEKDLQTYYRTFISIHSQARVAEDQFVAYWQGVANRTIGTLFWARVFVGARFSFTYDIGEPIYNETKDQARFKVTITITETRPSLFTTTSTQQTQIVFVHVVKELSIWKLVIPDDLVSEMQKLPTKLVARRYAVVRDVSAKGLRLAVASLSIENDMTILEVALENANDVTAELLGAISGATLTDETRAVYPSRTLRSSLPSSVGPRQSVKGTLAFQPIPPASRSVVLGFPEVRVGEESVTLSLEITLR